MSLVVCGCARRQRLTSHSLSMDSRIAIVGQNGTGKSTLLNLITGDLQPLQGSVNRHPSLKLGASLLLQLSAAQELTRAPQPSTVSTLPTSSRTASRPSSTSRPSTRPSSPSATCPTGAERSVASESLDPTRRPRSASSPTDSAIASSSPSSRSSTRTVRPRQPAHQLRKAHSAPFCSSPPRRADQPLGHGLDRRPRPRHQGVHRRSRHRLARLPSHIAGRRAALGGQGQEDPRPVQDRRRHCQVRPTPSPLRTNTDQRLASAGTRTPLFKTRATRSRRQSSSRTSILSLPDQAWSPTDSRPTRSKGGKSVKV